MIATIWRFRVPAESVAEFERAYGPRGDWAELFALAPGYAGTELLALRGEQGVYVTIDRWHTEADFQNAKTLLEHDYAVLDRRCEAYTSEETWLGLYASVD
jgi:heme-degrading monooxygenase HmoA